MSDTIKKGSVPRDLLTRKFEKKDYQEAVNNGIESTAAFTPGDIEHIKQAASNNLSNLAQKHSDQGNGMSGTVEEKQASHGQSLIAEQTGMAETVDIPMEVWKVKLGPREFEISNAELNAFLFEIGMSRDYFEENVRGKEEQDDIALQTVGQLSKHLRAKFIGAFVEEYESVLSGELTAEEDRKSAFTKVLDKRQESAEGMFFLYNYPGMVKELEKATVENSAQSIEAVRDKARLSQIKEAEGLYQASLKRISLAQRKRREKTQNMSKLLGTIDEVSEQDKPKTSKWTKWLGGTQQSKQSDSQRRIEQKRQEELDGLL